ncbi:MAG: RidA family protein [Novosphingobium sp.]
MVNSIDDMPVGQINRFPASARAANLILTATSVGRLAGGDGGQASTQAYLRLLTSLANHGLTASSMIRLDHFTQSQGWLAARQKARAACFGMPAPLASTGIATPQERDCLLTVSGIALAEGEARLVAAGAEHNMPAIAAAVRGGPFLFISGILSDGKGSAQSQIEYCLRKIEDLLAMENLTPESLLRLDIFAESQEAVSRAVDVMRTRWPAASFVTGGGPGLFEQEGQIEINALALAGDTPKRIGANERWVAGGGLALSQSWELARGMPAPAMAEAFVELLQEEMKGMDLHPESLARLELRVPPEQVRVARTVQMVGARLDPQSRPAVVTWIADAPPAVRAIVDLPAQP